MGLIVLAAAAVLFVLCATAPKRYVAHAAKVKRLTVPAVSRFIPTGPIRDPDGKPVTLEGKELFLAEGHSMEANNIPAGSTCIADKLTDETRRALKPGDVVVVDAHTDYSQSGMRLRKVVDVHKDGLVSFENTDHDRPLSEIRARVTHVLENAA
jgi:hypothetical protein